MDRVVLRAAIDAVAHIGAGQHVVTGEPLEVEAAAGGRRGKRGEIEHIGAGIALHRPALVEQLEAVLGGKAIDRDGALDGQFIGAGAAQQARQGAA